VSEQARKRRFVRTKRSLLKDNPMSTTMLQEKHFYCFHRQTRHNVFVYTPHILTSGVYTQHIWAVVFQNPRAGGTTNAAGRKTLHL